MTCKDIHEQITAFVDDRIDEVEYREKVQQHIEYCPDCRSVYEMELLTKLAVKHHTSRVPTPDALRRAIASEVEQIEKQRLAEIELQRPGVDTTDWIDRFARQYLSPVGIGLALVLVSAASYLLVDPFASGFGPIGSDPVVEQPSGSADPGNADPGSESGAVAVNFFNKAAENFRAIESRQLGVQFESSNPEELATFFRENGVSYPVRFANVTLPLVGGVVSSHGSTRLAHLVYLDRDTIVYIFEIPVALLDRREIFYVSEDVLNRLRSGEQIWDANASGVSTLMLRQDAVVLAVVANLDRASFERVVPIQ